MVAVSVTVGLVPKREGAIGERLDLEEFWSELGSDDLSQ